MFSGTKAIDLMPLVSRLDNFQRLHYKTSRPIERGKNRKTRYTRKREREAFLHFVENVMLTQK